jgi:hypothetical protein
MQLKSGTRVLDRTGSKNYATHNHLTLPRGRRQVGTQDLKQCGPWLI